jgi:hypothetical protein
VDAGTTSRRRSPGLDHVGGFVGEEHLMNRKPSAVRVTPSFTG